MNIVYVSNENYARHMAVSMVSLFDRNRSRKELTVYVFSIGITSKSRRLLQDMADGYGRTIRWIDLDNLREQFDFQIHTQGFDISAMGRLFAGSLLPDTATRVLYLDCDTVVTRSLKELWNTCLHGNVAGAVMEPTIYEPVKEKIGLGSQDAYVNSGVLLIDLKLWRQQGIERQLLDFYREKEGRLFACDQDLINGVLKGKICFLPPKYNFFSNYRYFSYKELVRRSETYKAVGKKAFQTAKRHPAIIHYAGDERPWVRGNFNHYRRVYEHYLSLTPWAGTPKEPGRELYMAAYHLMNYVTVLCPKIREMISSGFGMKMVEARGISREKEDAPKKIAVLLASYNGRDYIEAQLDSILAQTAWDLKIIVSDDGSTDGTREFLEQYQRYYPDRVFLKHRPDQGPWAALCSHMPRPARNFFWLMSQTDEDYILLSDQDDVWYPDKVEKLLERMRQVETAGKPALVFSDMEVVDEDLWQISPSFFAYSRCNPRRTSLAEILAENPVTGGSLMMNRPLLKLCSGMPRACFMHDWWISLCASCFGVISCVREPLSMYRQHGGNALGAKRTGSLEDLRERRRRQKEVEDNYRLMFLQAAALKREFKEQLSPAQHRTLGAFLSLPRMNGADRLKTIVRYGFFKSSLLQTTAQIITIPSEFQIKNSRPKKETTDSSAGKGADIHEN